MLVVKIYLLLVLINLLLILQLNRLDGLPPEKLDSREWVLAISMSFIPPLAWILFIVAFFQSEQVRGFFTKERYIFHKDE